MSRLKTILASVLVVLMCVGCSSMSMSKKMKCASVGAATGAAVGATLGGVIGHNGSGAHVRTEGAIVGGGIGAIVGGVTGYFICKDEPAPAPPVAEPKAPVKVAEKIILNGVKFDFDKAVINAEYIPMLDAGIASLKKYPDKKIVVTGHTCDMGSDSYNQTLSEKRAMAVKEYMVLNGILASRVTSTGNGEANPVADNTTKAGRMMNRRAEILILE